MLSYVRRPRPWRRRGILSRIASGLVIALVVVSLATLSSAIELESSDQDTQLFKQLAQRGEILIDQRAPPPRPAPGLGRRQEDTGPSSSTGTKSVMPSAPAQSTSSADQSMLTSRLASPSTPSTTTAPGPASSAKVASTTSTMTDAPTSTTTTTDPSGVSPSSPLPSPFDTSLGSNFTSPSCPTFFNTFLANATFQSCTPVSLLLQNSISFFHASRSIILLSLTLDAACAVNMQHCSALMSSLATQLTSDSNCGLDFRAQNPLVSQAHAGFVAYEPIYGATCLKNAETGNYCFNDAITNTTNPSDAYPYYTPLGINLPGASRPTCDKCLQDTMGVFAGYAGNKEQGLAETYTNTAQRIDVGCGPDFVNSTVRVGVYKSGAWHSKAERGAAVVAALMAIVFIAV